MVRRGAWILAVALCASSRAAASDAKLDLNRMSVDDLARVPFVGEVFAEVLVEERAARGPYRDFADVRARLEGADEGLVAQWAAWLRIPDAGPSSEVRLDYAALREPAHHWETVRRTASAEVPLGRSAVLRAAVSGTRAVASCRARGWTVTGALRPGGSATARIPSARSGAAQLRALLPRGQGSRVVAEAQGGVLAWTAACYGRPRSTDTALAIDDAPEDSVIDIAPADDPAVVVGLATAGAAPVAGTVLCALPRTGPARLSASASRRFLLSAADVVAGGWWDGTPHAFVSAQSGDPAHDLAWDASAEASLSTRALAAGARLARVAIEMRRAAGDAWTGRVAVAGDVRAPSATALRPSVRASVTAEMARAGVSADAPRVSVRAALHATERTDDTDGSRPGPRWETPRATGAVVLRPPGAPCRFALAGAANSDAEGAWTAGWSAGTAVRRGLSATVHLVAHAVSRGSVAPAWPLLAATLRPRGRGLDLVLDLRTGGDDGLLVGRGFTPDGRPRWWCRVRLGWPR